MNTSLCVMCKKDKESFIFLLPNGSEFVVLGVRGRFSSAFSLELSLCLFDDNDNFFFL